MGIYPLPQCLHRAIPEICTKLMKNFWVSPEYINSSPGTHDSCLTAPKSKDFNVIFQTFFFGGGEGAKLPDPIQTVLHDPPPL